MSVRNVSATDVLLVIDVQNDFCAGGALAVPDGDQVVPIINHLARQFPHVVLTQDWHPAGHLSFASVHPGHRPFDMIEIGHIPQVLWPDHCVQGSAGAAFHPGLWVPHAEMIIRKGFRQDVDSYSAFFENDRTTPTGLTGFMRERGFRRVVLCGLAMDYCVRYSAEDASRMGFSVAVVRDATAAIDVDGSLAAARKSFAALGVPEIAAAEFDREPEYGHQAT